MLKGFQPYGEEKIFFLYSPIDYRIRKHYLDD